MCQRLLIKSSKKIVLYKHARASSANKHVLKVFSMKLAPIISRYDSNVFKRITNDLNNKTPHRFQRALIVISL